MLIEVRGVQFVNKGAELMLHAVLKKVGEAFPDASFAMAPSGKGDYVKRARLGLYQKVWLKKYGMHLEWVIPQKLRRLFGLILDKEVDLVLDASGFTYSDQCLASSSVNMASHVKRWKKRGATVVLLPQAFGPFTSTETRNAFAFVVANSDLVFARDEVSYQHLIGLVGEQENIHQSPDFTNVVPGVLPDNPDKYRGRFCLIPNCRMVRDTSRRESEQYPSFCAMCLRLLIELGQRPFILIHEGEGDVRIAETILGKVEEDIEIVKDGDALRIKGLLGLCAGVISSRFHGLVSALSQGVPVLATGWSHKYEMLLREYDIQGSCLPVVVEPDVLRRQIQALVDDTMRGDVVSRISMAAAVHKERTEVMWQRVFCAIHKGTSE